MMKKEKPSFSSVAKEVFKEMLPGSACKSLWTGKSNVSWAAAGIGEDLYGYYIVQRGSGDRITGELAVSQGMENPGSFAPLHNPVTGKINPPCKRYRERIGWLISGEDTWWPCSRDPEGLKEDIAMVVKLLLENAPKFFEEARVHMERRRRSYEDSCRLLQELGYIEEGDIPPMPDRMPRHDDPDPLGVGFFRTRVGPDDLDNLTLPRTFWGRSEVREVSFVNTDLSESNLCWNDFIDVDFSNAVLSDADMRASIFRNVKFTGCELRNADLRRSTFEGCDFSGAMMKGAKLTRSQKLGLELSSAQIKEVDWCWFAGEEPGGG